MLLPFLFVFNGDERSGVNFDLLSGETLKERDLASHPLRDVSLKNGDAHIFSEHVQNWQMCFEPHSVRADHAGHWALKTRGAVTVFIDEVCAGSANRVTEVFALFR